MEKSTTALRFGVFGPLLAATIISGCAAPQYGYLPRETDRRAFIPRQLIEMNGQYPYFTSCDKYQQIYDEKNWPKGDTLDVVTKIDELVRERFVYRREKIDDWNAYVSLMLETNHRWYGDCDDLSATVVALARCAGVPEESLGLFLTSTDGGEVANHIVGFFVDAQGRSHVIGDTFGKVRPLVNWNQRLISWTHLDNLGIWNKVDPDVDYTKPLSVASGG